MKSTIQTISNDIQSSPVQGGLEFGHPNSDHQIRGNSFKFQSLPCNFRNFRGNQQNWAHHTASAHGTVALDPTLSIQSVVVEFGFEWQPVSQFGQNWRPSVKSGRSVSESKPRPGLDCRLDWHGLNFILH